ncbi:hypothetical protein ABL78_3451 [Leptomonas seymouri]|uniref:Uncharacterized protein n=1 Tax=Leptomonas seymouri TaxID=5684 RepID=A0A0N1PDS8_LEPSE|nr:hypothetical protein ABL78_3451 [Leptomonas seymouri]|eukprot:KPI87462.1 hypothetical protein ABL78_3451 [Leptomonas seymouri]
MSRTPSPHSQGGPPAARSPSLPLPLPILTEDDIAALPPPPLSSSASAAPSGISTSAEASGNEAEDSPTPLDSPLSQSEPSVLLQDEEHAAEKGGEVQGTETRGHGIYHSTHEHADTAVEGRKMQESVDAPLAMPELPQQPLSVSPTSAWSASLSLPSPPSYPYPDLPVAGGSVAGPGTPAAVVDAASETWDDDNEEERAQRAHQRLPESGLVQQSFTGVSTTAPGNPTRATGEEDTVSEEVVAESLRLSEEHAAAALNRFSTALQVKLVEQLIDDAVVAMEETLHHTIRQHGTQIRALVAHNEALEAQLTSQATRMQSVQKALEDTITKDLQRVLRVDLRAALHAHESMSSTLLASPPSDAQRSATGGGNEEAVGEEEQEQCDSDSAPLSPESKASSGETPIQAHRDLGMSSSNRASAESAAQLMSADELIVAYLGGRGTIEVLQRERDEWRRNASSLQASLLSATQENAALRREVEQLRATTVDLEAHCAVVAAREEAEHQCALLELQLAKQVAEAETLVALVERQQITELSRATGATAASPVLEGAAAAPSTSTNENDRGEAVRKGPVWDIAIRELEEQATIAANSRHLHEQLAKAEAEVRELKAARDASVAYAAALKEEGDALRADAQSMVYRNSVLSQQVASLLVKVECSARACRHLKESAAHQQQQGTSPQLIEAPRATATSSSSSRTHDHSMASSSILKSLPSTSSRRSNWLASMWPAVNASRNAVCSPEATSIQQSTTCAAGVGTSLNTAVVYDHPSSSDIQQLLHMPGASADVSFMHSPTEIEEGLQQRLNTYSASHVSVPSALLSAASSSSPHHRYLSHRSRKTSLRQLGSATLEVDPACKPRLPASDQLSGLALGQPPSFSTLDPLTGTVTRLVGKAYLSTLQDGEGRVSVPSAPPSVVASEDDVNQDPQLLCLLETLDKDESLDRFSVNSVSELVVRNQELVKQLYEATQRAEAAEQQQQRQASLNKERAHSTAHASESSQALPASLTTPTAALLQHAATAATLQRRSAEMPSRKRDREDVGERLSNAEATNENVTVADTHGQGRGSAGLVHSEHAAHTDASSTDSEASQAEEKTTQSVDAASAVEPWFLESANEAVARMVDALVRRHEVRLTAVDTDVSRALLRALAAQREADHAVHAHTLSTGAAVDPIAAASADRGEASAMAAAPAVSSAPSRAMAVCLRSLLQLCVRQSATLAEVALNAAGQQQEMQKAVKETWTEVQETLVRALQTSQMALASSRHSCHSNSNSSSSGGAETLVSSSLRASPFQRTRSEAESASSSAVMTTTEPNALQAVMALPHRRDDELRVDDQVALLQQLNSLLQTAAKKDGTLLHVYQAAQARQEARQHQQKERMARLLLKLERKRRLIKALRVRQAYVGVDAVARGLSHTGQDLDDCSSTQNTAAAASFRLPSQPGSPVHRTPPLPPMSLPSATVPGSPQPRLRHTQSHRTENDDVDERTDCVSSQQSDRSEAESEDYMDEDMTLDVFRELQQQLAFSQATHRTVQEELDAEKLKHTAMLERMWALETARDEAVAAKETLEKQIQGMIPRSIHESVADALKSTTDELEDRNTQLSSALTAHHALQEKISAQQAQLEAQQLQSKVQCGQLEEVARRREQLLVAEESRYRELHAQLSDVKQHAAGLENAIALLRRELQEKAQIIRQREETIDELKDQTLMRDDVQALLRRLYPDNSVVQANAQLVQHLSQTTTRLQMALAEVKQDLAHTQDELRQRDLSAREAVQDRQAAEVRLQDAVARLAELQDVSLDRFDNAEGHHSSASSPESPAGGTSPTLESIDAFFSVEDASLTALRHRVHYLTARMEAQAKDLAVMRDAEAAWKAREEDLRRQLEVMSADPISLAARRYGLTACTNFSSQMAEMQARLDALRCSLTDAEEEKKKLKEQVETAMRKEAETEKRRAEATAQVLRAEEQLAASEAESRDRKAAIVLLEAQLLEMTATHDELLQQHRQISSDLEGEKNALSEMQASLQACRTQRDQFLADNKQMISAVEKLEKALLQSEAEKEMAREALAQGLSSSSSRRHRGGGGARGTAAERYQNQTSLTQDLSLSSINPNP